MNQKEAENLLETSDVWDYIGDKHPEAEKEFWKLCECLSLAFDCEDHEIASSVCESTFYNDGLSNFIRTNKG